MSGEPMRWSNPAAYAGLPDADLIALAWLSEMAAVGCDHRDKKHWADQLRIDASRLRAAAVDR